MSCQRKTYSIKNEQLYNLFASCGPKQQQQHQTNKRATYIFNCLTKFKTYC